MSKHVFRALGLSLLAALGLMAVVVAGAQAENLKPPFTHGQFLVEGKELQAQVIGSAEGESRILVPNLGAEIACKDFEVIEASVNLTAGDGKVVALPLGCLLWAIEKVPPFKLTGTEPLPCLPLDSVTGKHEHIRFESLVLTVLHEGKTYLIYEQVELIKALPLAVVKFSSGTGCPIPLKQEVFGEYAVEINTGDLQTGKEVTEPLITAGNGKTLQELFGIKLLYGANEAFMDGSAKLRLLGEHEGLRWGMI